MPSSPYRPEPVCQVLLCGAAGFLGRAVLAALLERGFHVKALDLSEDSWTDPRAHGRARAESGLPAARPGLELAYGDISDYATVAGALAGCAAVIHTTVFFPQVAPGEQQGC